MQVVIVDYNAGNLRNVQKAFEVNGCFAVISQQASVLTQADVIVLPGVGAFSDGMMSLKALSLDQIIYKSVIELKKPLFGICLGMQLLAKESEEGEQLSEGLGIIDARVRRLAGERCGLPVPHMGWNSIAFQGDAELFTGLPTNPDFYFAHSYHVVCEDKAAVIATCNYGEEFVASIACDNIFAAQFHPEKSQRYGLKIINNFLQHCYKVTNIC